MAKTYRFGDLIFTSKKLRDLAEVLYAARQKCVVPADLQFTTVKQLTKKLRRAIEENCIPVETRPIINEYVLIRSIRDAAIVGNIKCRIVLDSKVIPYSVPFEITDEGVEILNSCGDYGEFDEDEGSHDYALERADIDHAGFFA